MNLTGIKYALEIEECGSVTSAAKRLSVSQPNLSKMVKELEIRLGFPIFVRKNKGMIPTKKGEEFLREARNVMKQLDGLERFSQANREDKVEFGVAAPRASYITHGFTRFMQQVDDGRDLQIYFSETNSMDTINDIVEQKFTSGIIRYDVRYEEYFLSMLQLEGLTYEPLLEFEYVFIMSKNNALANKKTIYYHDLENCIEIRHGDTVIPSLVHNDTLSQTERSARRCIYVFERGSQFDLLADESNTFMWVSPLPETILNRYHLFQKPCADYRRQMKDLYIYPKDYELTKYETMFIEEVRKVVRELEIIQSV